MEKTWLFIKGHLALIIAIAVGLLSYICFGGAAFSYAMPAAPPAVRGEWVLVVAYPVNNQ